MLGYQFLFNKLFYNEFTQMKEDSLQKKSLTTTLHQILGLEFNYLKLDYLNTFLIFRIYK